MAKLIIFNPDKVYEYDSLQISQQSGLILTMQNGKIGFCLVLCFFFIVFPLFSLLRMKINTRSVCKSQNMSHLNFHAYFFAPREGHLTKFKDIQKIADTS